MSSTQLEGKTIGKYQIRRKVGDGGQAVVYEAWYEDLQAPVAIKFLHDSIAQHPAIRERFKREARLQFKLQHPHIVRVTEIIEHDGVMGMVMDWVQGPDLAAYLKKRTTPLTAKDIEILFLPVLRALDFAHKKNVIHRDLKPANILVDLSTGTPTPKVMDFGIAKSLEDEGQHTKTNALLGTPHYIAPEQANSSKHVDHRADIYALGVMLYQMLCGRLPFEGRDLLQLISAHLLEPPPPMRTWGVHVAPALEAIAGKALAKNPAERFESCQAFEQALQKALPQQGTSVLCVPFEAAQAPILPTGSMSAAAFMATEDGSKASLPSIPPQEPRDGSVQPVPPQGSMIPSGDLDILEKPSFPNHPEERPVRKHPQEPFHLSARSASSPKKGSMRFPAFLSVLVGMAGVTFLILSLLFGRFAPRSTITEPRPLAPTAAVPHRAMVAPRESRISPPPSRPPQTPNTPTPSSKSPNPLTKTNPSSPTTSHLPDRQAPPQQLLRKASLSSRRPKARTKSVGNIAAVMERRCLRCLQDKIAPKRESRGLTQTYGTPRDIKRSVRPCAKKCGGDMELFCRSLRGVKVPVPPFNDKKGLLELTYHVRSFVDAIFAEKSFYKENVSRELCQKSLQKRP